MADQRNRYPGAQPFSDNDFSRRVFFGRGSASRILADKILANRMVIVYARSGLGKTSLLQAGVAPRLREEDHLPLFVRVNDLRNGPFQGVLQTIPGEAERQGIEYVPGLPESLWSFFKTAEFWRGDLLLTPVLVLDQFEELFTLQSEQARAHFLDQLSYLTRGVRPPSATPAAEELSEHPPAVRIVLSLREDYLGFLEEAAEHIPQILDARFRPAPLDLHAAEEAIVGPAAVRDPGLETRPFALDRHAVTSILNYLSQRRTRTVGETRRYVEPFQLQLICRRIEQIAAARQAASGPDLTITMADLGGEAGLTRTLRDFYREAIHTLPDRHGRRACRRLCEEYLISPEGRRLSLEENELRRQLDLPKETLSRLVASRLLRSENRSESTYYELSHDALVEPIFASRRTKARVMGAFGIGSGALLFLLSLFAVVAMVYYMLTEYVFASETSEFVGEVIGLFLVMLGGLGIVVSSAMLLRGSARSILRYRRGRGPGPAVPETRRRSGFVSGLPALIGGGILSLLALLLLFFVLVMLLAPLSESARSVARQLDLAPYVDQLIANGIGIDTVVYFLAAAAMLAAGARLCQWGVYRLAGIRARRSREASDAARANPTLYAASRLLLGGIALSAALLLLGFCLVKVECGYVAPGVVPRWLPAASFNLLITDCMAGYPDGLAGELFLDFILIIALLLIAIPALWRGFAGIRRIHSGRPAAPAIARTDSAEQFS
jgi:hypothetical protein